MLPQKYAKFLILLVFAMNKEVGKKSSAACIIFQQEESTSLNISSYHFAVPQKMLGIIAKFRF